MAEFTIHTLGCGSAKPTLRHSPSCTVVEFRGNLFMVDCGEGAQRAFMKQRLKFSRLNHIFLTHLHGDHVLGLPGLLSTLGLHDTGGNLTIHTFASGEKILRDIIAFFAPYLPYNVQFNILDPKGGETAFENKSLRVRTVALNHRVDCVGYVFEEKEGPRHINREMCDFHNVPVVRFNALKSGEDFVKPDGTVVPNEVLTTPPSRPLSYAHISDTAFTPSLAGAIGPVTLLFHETTYLEADKPSAAPRGHSTAAEAAEMAKLSGARYLLTGHYSSRYKDDEGFLHEAKSVFPRVLLNCEGLRADLTKLP